MLFEYRIARKTGNFVDQRHHAEVALERVHCERWRVGLSRVRNDCWHDFHSACGFPGAHAAPVALVALEEFPHVSLLPQART